MDKLIWIPELSVGVSIFDEQHKSVIQMINRLIDAQNDTTDSETVSDLLTRMTAYAEMHLSAEEKMMTEYNYPAFVQHKAEHIAYRKKAVDFCTATHIRVEGIPMALLSYLRNWWEHHIQHTDKAYTSFFNNAGIR